MKKIMAVNAGSSSLKFQLLEMPEEVVITEGIVERIGSDDGIYTIKISGVKERRVLPVKNHSIAVDLVLNDLIQKGIIHDLKEITGIGHRVVQGGVTYHQSVLIDDEVIAEITRLCDLAPLHNPANLIGIDAFSKILPDVKQVAVFDTAFHQTMAPEAYMYAIPYEWYEKYGIRKYGAHGTSHQYVAQEAAKLLGKPLEECKIITIHLGNGASLAAVKNGKCIDTSMGLTPLGGIPMGTRSGDIDPAVIEYISKKENLSITQVINILNKKSGYLGVSGVSNDSRDLEQGMDEGNERCKLAIDIQYKRIADFVGSYYVYMGGVDAIVFTAGIGENSDRCRAEVVGRLAALGMTLDEKANHVRSKTTLVTTPDSKVKAYLIPTNEELVIARDTLRLIEA
ncbi:MAG: acetate kinase [Bacilli bacterium]|nr:acetate kinase [Bacilli bacterium]